jgi:glutathione S-transferase
MVDIEGMAHMILIGMFDSPFVRRVAVSMNLLKLTFEHRNWSVGKDFELIRQFNPLGRVPALVLADGESLVDSAAILDFLDDLVGAERALLPKTGKERRDALRAVAVALGAAEKGLHQLYETVFKPDSKRHEPWMDRCRQQMHGALGELDRLAQGRPGGWMVGTRLTQADITATCVYTYLCDALGLAESWREYPGLAALAARCEALPAFAQSKLKFDPPSPTPAPAG